MEFVCFCFFWSVEDNFRPTVSQPVCLGVRHPSGTRDQSFFLLEIFFRQLQVCYFVAPSLTRGRVCNLLVQLLLGLGSKFRRTHGLILLSHLRLPQPGERERGRKLRGVVRFTTIVGGRKQYFRSWRARSPYLYPPGTRWPSYTPGHWVPLTTRRVTVEVL
jgi:hypothetical protein